MRLDATFDGSAPEVMVFTQHVITGALDALLQHIMDTCGAKEGIDKEAGAIVGVNEVIKNAYNSFADAHKDAFEKSKVIQREFEKHKAERNN